MKMGCGHKNQDGAWIGNVNAGLRYSLCDENYSRPLNTNFYLLKPLKLPASWGNEPMVALMLVKKGILYICPVVGSKKERTPLQFLNN